MTEAELICMRSMLTNIIASLLWTTEGRRWVLETITNPSWSRDLVTRINRNTVPGLTASSGLRTVKNWTIYWQVSQAFPSSSQTLCEGRDVICRERGLGRQADMIRAIWADVFCLAPRHSWVYLSALPFNYLKFCTRLSRTQCLSTFIQILPIKKERGAHRLRSHAAPTFVRSRLTSHHHHHITIQAFPQSMSPINISGTQISEFSCWTVRLAVSWTQFFVVVADNVGIHLNSTWRDDTERISILTVTQTLHTIH